jgi:hypothetical protein
VLSKERRTSLRFPLNKVSANAMLSSTPDSTRDVD